MLVAGQAPEAPEQEVLRSPVQVAVQPAEGQAPVQQVQGAVQEAQMAPELQVQGPAWAQEEPVEAQVMAEDQQCCEYLQTDREPTRSRHELENQARWWMGMAAGGRRGMLFHQKQRGGR